MAEASRDGRSGCADVYRQYISATPRLALRCLPYGRLPSAVGYQPNLQQEMGLVARAHHEYQKGLITLCRLSVPADDSTDPAPAPALPTQTRLLAMNRAFD